MQFVLDSNYCIGPCNYVAEVSIGTRAVDWRGVSQTHG